MKQRKKLFSWILVLSMVIMMVPLNVFAANLENTTDFKYSPPEDIIIYKNETKDFKYKSDDASLDIEQNELAQKYLDELLATRESITYKVGRFFTYIPRLVRHLIFKSPM